MEAIRTILEDLRSSFEADGYDLAWSLDGGVLRVEITARPDACAECLVPKDALRGLIAGLLAETDAGRQVRAIELRYPTDPGG